MNPTHQNIEDAWTVEVLLESHADIELFLHGPFCDAGHQVRPFIFDIQDTRSAVYYRQSGISVSRNSGISILGKKI